MMTDDLISRRETLEKMNKVASHAFNAYYKGCKRCIDIVIDLPSMGKAHGLGKWEKMREVSDGTIYKCSECGIEYKVNEGKMFFNFCPECGTDMRMEEK